MNISLDQKKAAQTDDFSSAHPGSQDGFVLTAQNIKKTYGPTTAVNQVNVSISPGEVIGLVGANGAGKSTLMRSLSGVTIPDSGSLAIGGKEINWNQYSPTLASKLGVRVVYQELSLCTNLTVYENFYIEQSQRFKGSQNWRKKAKEIAHEALNSVFPNHSIDVKARLDSLPIAHQQMVEIARATSDLNLKLLILDEPTSSLGAEQTAQLVQYVKTRSRQGVSFIFISHRLSEIMNLANRILVMQNGTLKWSGSVSETNEADLIQKMGENMCEPDKDNTGKKSRSALVKDDGNETGFTVSHLNTKGLQDINLELKGGGIIGIAGLEGSGQRDLLHSLFHPVKGEKKSVLRKGKIAYVTGDRKKEGIFPLWSIAKNMEITKLAEGKLFRYIQSKSVNSEVKEWYEQLKIVGSGIDTCITSLSGGNQQKVLIARSLMANADIIILDDPTRGVDVQTKQQLYRIFEQAADEGKLVIWYSTDDEELCFCSRVLVLRYGKVVKELTQEEATKDNIIQASFSGEDSKKTNRVVSQKKRLDLGSTFIPFMAMVLVYIVSGLISPNVFSSFGIELLISGAVPLIFATISQMYIIGLGQVDLGIGAFMGLVNVLCATALHDKPVFGIFALLIALALYSGMGALIYFRNIPAIIVTLGGSFIWTGIAYTLQNMPGGQAPDWLITFFGYKTPLLPEIVWLVILATLLAYGIHRSRYGTVLRGFGNNPQSMRRSGWSTMVAYTTGYLISGIFALMGGLAVTAITTASDANATASYTLLTIAAVVMGGGNLTGGIVTTIGAVFGAITLSLIGSLLGFLNISSNYVAAVQGSILLLVLALRLLRKDQEQ